MEREGGRAPESGIWGLRINPWGSQPQAPSVVCIGKYSALKAAPKEACRKLFCASCHGLKIDNSYQ